MSGSESQTRCTLSQSTKCLLQGNFIALQTSHFHRKRPALSSSSNEAVSAFWHEWQICDFFTLRMHPKCLDRWMHSCCSCGFIVNQELVKYEVFVGKMTFVTLCSHWTRAVSNCTPRVREQSPRPRRGQRGPPSSPSPRPERQRINQSKRGARAFGVTWRHSLSKSASVKKC